MALNGNADKYTIHKRYRGFKIGVRNAVIFIAYRFLLSSGESINLKRAASVVYFAGKLSGKDEMIAMMFIRSWNWNKDLR